MQIQSHNTQATYRMKPFWLWLIVAASLAGVVLSVGAVLEAVATPPDQRIPHIFLISALGAAMSICLGAITLRSKVSLLGDTISLVEFGAPRRLRREQIAGVRRRYSNGITLFRLIPREPGVKGLDIGTTYALDDAFFRWLDGLPDLDAEDAQRAHEELLAGEELGDTIEERAARLARAQRVASALGAMGIATFFWAAFYPRPYVAAVATVVLLPLAVLVVLLTGRGAYSTQLDPRPGCPSLGVALAMSSGACGILALGSFHLVSSQKAAACAGVAGVGLLALVVMGDRGARKRIWDLLMLLAALSFYSLGGLVLANCLEERSAPQSFRAEVLRKIEPSSRDRSGQLELGPWVFDAVEQGQEVTVSVRPGRLGLPWFWIAAPRE
jgi:hypothetical protein